MASPTQINTGDLMVVKQSAIALVDQFGKDEASRSPAETQYDMRLSTLPKSTLVLVTYVSQENVTMVQVMHEGIRYWVDSGMLTDPSAG